MITLNSIIDEMLSVEKGEPVKKATIIDRVRNFARRKEIEKAVNDEINLERQTTLKAETETRNFLSSSWYRDLVEPHLKSTIKSNLQIIIREGESMGEAQLKCKIAEIKGALSFLASLRLKIVRGEMLKQEIRITNGH